MSLQRRSVSVERLKETFNAEEERAFLQELKDRVEGYRPRIVLNCSDLRGLGGSSLHLLLCCLEEAMKRNGDIKLSAVQSAAQSVLNAAGIDRLFEIYESDADAIRSFQRFPVDGSDGAFTACAELDAEAPARRAMFPIGENAA
jgi:anti-anti-sigma factor